MKKQNRKTAELHLPIFKQGCDLADHLEAHRGDCDKALLAYAERLTTASKLVMQLAEAIQGSAVVINADCHVIQVDGPTELIEALVGNGLLSEDALEEEEPEWDDEPEWCSSIES